MIRLRQVLVWPLATGAFALAWTAWVRTELDRPPETAVFRTAGGYVCPIVLPARPTAEETAAARLLMETLTAAAGLPPTAAHVVRESGWPAARGGIFVGETRRGRDLVVGSGDLLDRAVGWQETPATLVLRASHREDIAGAAGLWLERRLGARWFMPGPLGVHVPGRPELAFEPGRATAAPSFVSRDVSGGDAAWSAANGLRTVFAHGHGMSTIFRAEDLRRDAELAPTIGGQKLLPPAGDWNWQPNIVSSRAVAHAVERGREFFESRPAAVAFVAGMNDSIRYDQSPATVQAAGPPRYFRGRPVYSDLVFDFINRVARGLAKEFPDRFVATYAYDWTEQTPGFPVEANVVPFLTADRLRYSDRAFAREDMDLMTRWVHQGPRVVALYDYYEGSPYFVPRLDTAAIAESIGHAHRTGIRAFYAEGAPNWGLDGPKLWLAARLLWDAGQDSAALLDVYYRDFWQEAAGPMRQFYTLAEQVWKAQPLPTYWLKYYKDEHQARLFSEATRREMRARLSEARAAATTDLVRRRVAFVAAAFAVTDAWCGFCEAREGLSEIALAPVLDVPAAVGGLAQYEHRRAGVLAACAAQRRSAPLAVSPLPVEEYLRADPRARLLDRLAREAPAALGEPVARAALDTLGGPATEGTVLAGPGRGVAVDSELRGLRLKPIFDATTTDYTAAGAWRGHGEPYETRAIALVPGAAGAQTLRFSLCKQETLSQWRTAEAGALYRATVRVRAKVSPGNRTFLIVSCLDAKGAHIGYGATDRLPVGDWSGREHRLTVVVRVPQGAAQVGVGVRVLDQVNDDFAEFAGIELLRLDEPAGGTFSIPEPP